MIRSKLGGVAALGLAAMMVMTRPSHAAEIHVLVSGAFTGAFRTIVPRFEQASGHKLVLAWGPSFGTTKDALPVRIAAGETADVLLIVGASLDKLVAEGRYAPASRTAIAQSRIGVGVKAGATKPDVGSIDALRQALLAARSIGYSEGASGVFVSTDLINRLGIADRVAGKMRKVTGELVGEAVARGEVELGIQQVSELLSVSGVDFVGPLPEEVQKASPMTAAVSEKSKQIEAAKEFVAFLSTPESRQDLARSGLDPVETRKSQPSQ